MRQSKECKKHSRVCSNPPKWRRRAGQRREKLEEGGGRICDDYLKMKG